MTAYAGYLDAETTASQHADFASVELTRFMAQPLLGQWVAQLYHLHAIGYKQIGAVISAAPAVQSLAVVTAKGTGIAIVTDCLDEVNLKIVKVCNGDRWSLPKHNSRYQTARPCTLQAGCGGCLKWTPIGAARADPTSSSSPWGWLSSAS